MEGRSHTTFLRLSSDRSEAGLCTFGSWRGRFSSNHPNKPEGTAGSHLRNTPESKPGTYAQTH